MLNIQKGTIKIEEAILKNKKESRKAVNKLTKARLSEIKVMNYPSQVIKCKIECVYYLLEGSSKLDWNGQLIYIWKDDFMNKVMDINKLKNSFNK